MSICNMLIVVVKDKFISFPNWLVSFLNFIFLMLRISAGIMSFMHKFRSQGGGTIHDDHWSSFPRNNFSYDNRNRGRANNHMRGFNGSYECSGRYREHMRNSNFVRPDNGPSWKRRKCSASTWGDGGRHYYHHNSYDYAPSTCNDPAPPTRVTANTSTSTSCKRNRSKLDDEEPVFMSRDEIERYSPSRKDGIDALRETHLRYSYCAFLQNLGLRLEL